MATEVITRKLCDMHALRGEKVEAAETLQFASEGVVLEVDACAECWKQHDEVYGPLVDVARVVKKRRKPRTTVTDADGAPEVAS